MPLRTFWATIAAQMRSASCSAVCSFAMSSAVRGRRCRDDCFVGSAARSGTGSPVVTGARLRADRRRARSSGGTSAFGNSTVFSSPLIA